MVMSLLTRPKKTVATIVVALDGTGDTTDIQTGINLLPAAGGVVYIKEGTYTITATITIPNDNIELHGAGSSTIIQTALNIPIFYAINLDHLSFHMLHLIGANNVLFTLNNGIEWNEVTDSIISNCWMEDCYDGIYLWNLSNHNRIINNDTSDNLNYGIHLDEVIAVIVNANTCYSNNTGIYGFCLGTIITNNDCSENNANGIQLDSSADTLISGNVCSVNIGIGIYLTYCISCAISINDVSGNWGDGIKLDSETVYCIISSNQCMMSDGWQINIDSSDEEDNLIAINYIQYDPAFPLFQLGNIRDNGTNTQIFNNKENIF